MAKLNNKGKKRKASESVKNHVVRKKQLNPFEMHINRKKHDVMGKELKNERGAPGISRAKALKKRKSTLLQEYKLKDKANQFFDRRIGERNSTMTTEDRMMARFAAEKMKAHNRKSIFNLADDEVLTHRGQTLNEIEKFENPCSDDDDDDGVGHLKGKLEADFVEDAHFGGGILKKSDGDGKKSRKDLIEELIAESKKRKAERQMTKEKTIELTEKLDNEWKDLLPIVTNSKRLLDKEEKSHPGSYDTVMKQLIFEARGKPSDRLKSENEIALEEKEKLEKLEADRLKRMHSYDVSSESSNANKNRLRSADDLDDGFEVDDDLNVPLHYNSEGKLENIDLKEKNNKEEDGYTDNEDANSDAASDGCDFDDPSSDSASEDKSNSSEDIDNLSDLKDIDSNSDDSANISCDSSKGKNHKNDTPHKQAKKLKSTTLSKSSISEITKSRPIQLLKKSHEDEKCNEKPANLLERKFLMDQARRELPYTFKVPESYEELQKIFSSYDPDHQSVVVERMIKCNHPSIAEGNKEKLMSLFAYLLQHLNDSASNEKEDSLPQCFYILDRLVPHFYELAHLSPSDSCHYVMEIIREKQADFKMSKNTFPDLDTLVFLKLISHLFPTSDFQHPVVTPTVIFMEQILWQCQVNCKRDVTAGLFIATIMLEYTVLSKRFSPAVISFLSGILYLTVDKTSNKGIKAVPPFHKQGIACHILEISEDYKYEKDANNTLMKLEDFEEKIPADDAFRVRSVWTAVSLLREFQLNFNSLPSAYYVFEPALQLINFLETSTLHSDLMIEMKTLKEAIDMMKENKYRHLSKEKKRPKALKLYEPNIEKVFDCKRHRPMSQVKMEHEKLVHKYKREMKGAVREIRKDRAFLGKLQLKQILKSDVERKEKVKEIFGAAAMQQGELNLIKRKKDARRR